MPYDNSFNHLSQRGSANLATTRSEVSIIFTYGMVVVLTACYIGCSPFINPFQYYPLSSLYLYVKFEINCHLDPGFFRNPRATPVKSYFGKFKLVDYLGDKQYKHSMNCSQEDNQSSKQMNLTPKNPLLIVSNQSRVGRNIAFGETHYTSLFDRCRDLAPLCYN